MTDRRDIPVETAEGWRPGPSRGERVMVAMAAIALLGGALIVGRNLLPKNDPSALASSSPGPSASASRAPQPTAEPTLGPTELTLTYGVPPSPQQVDPSTFTGWIRARVDLPVVGYPGAGAYSLGTLWAGEVAHADSAQNVPPEAGWVSITILGEAGEQERGFLATLNGAETLADRLVPTDYEASGSLSRIAAGPDGFLAVGSKAGSSAGDRPTVLFASADGVEWHEVRGGPAVGCCGVDVAWGPAGWLLVADPAGSGDSWVWSSHDGERWNALGSLPHDGPGRLQASEAGYLLTTYPGRSGSAVLWFSSDGIHWTASDPHLSSGFQVTATPLGFYAANDPNCCMLKAAFSSDGLTWSAATGAFVPRVVAAGRTILGLQTDMLSGELHAWRGVIGGARLTWQPMADSDGAFYGAAVTSLASGGRASVFGVDRSTDEPLAWTSDGVTWVRANLPAAFVGPPSLAASGERGPVVVGHRWNARGDNPLIWHEDPAGRWEAELDPAVGLAHPPSTIGCGHPPRDAVEFVLRDPAKSVACFGGAPITFRAWSVSCDHCGQEASGTYEPDWLANPSTNALYISPARGTDSWDTVVLSQDRPNPSEVGWRDTWLELTGHFDDPAAPMCRWTPPTDQLQWYSYSSTPAVVEGCRETFVVTQVRVVDGP